MASGIVGAESTPRPLSSMEYAESWLPAVTPATGSPIEPESAKVAVPRVSLDQESIHPFEMDPGHNGNSLSEAIQELPRHQQPPLHKKTSFAARLRKVFVKQGPSSSVETQEDIISLSSDDDNMADNHQAGPSLPIQHRGSVSSTSSSDTALGHGEIRRGSTQTVTPSTSPETSPLCSPTIASTSTLSSLGRQLGSVSSLSCPLPALDVDYTTESNDSDSQAVINDKRSLKALPSRAVKKKLSFASISSFFGSRNHQERHAKQQRSSSVPHVESPLTIVGRQIAGFQRRHSLNDPHDNNNNVKTKSSQSVHRLVTPPWDRDRVVLEGQSAAALTPGSAPIPAPTTSTKKMSLNSVFSKQLSKKKKKKNTNAPAPVPLPTKPLKSALVHRPPTSTPTRVHHVHSVSRRRSASIRSQNSARRRSYHHHHHQHNTSQHSSSSNDPFARLAEANQVLASLSRWNSEDQKTVRNQSKRDSPLDDQEPSFAEYDFCSSPSSLFEAAATFDGPQSPRRPPNKDSANTQFNSCTLSTPPTPRVLPITTRTTSPSGHSGSPYSPPFNPLSTLSRPSSCCSFASASEGIGSSSPVSERSTCSSSCSAYHGTVSCPQSGSRRLSNDQSFNPLLTASAARVSVDRIEMESQTNVSVMTGGGYTPTLKSNSSTFSNSSTAVSRASSMNYKIRSTAPTAVYAEHQQQRGYRQLQLEQQQLMTQPASQQQHEQHHHEHFYDQDYQKYYYEDSSSLYPPSRRQLQFSMEEPIVYATWTPEQYDRTSDTNITAIRLTPAIALKIKMELNHFKSQEMEVHQDSQIYTHFFI
ncbi:bud neck involved protein [Dissophora ornata]|nr:bud neck involved protein [Dissophora ornata]